MEAGSGSGARRRAVGGLLVGLLVRVLDRGDLLLGERAAFDEHAAQARERILRLRGGELLGRAVELVPVGVGVRVDAHALGVDEGAARARLRERHGLAHRAQRVEEVLAVAVDDLDVQEARRSCPTRSAFAVWSLFGTAMP